MLSHVRRQRGQGREQRRVWMVAAGLVYEAQGAKRVEPVGERLVAARGVGVARSDLLGDAFETDRLEQLCDPTPGGSGVSANDAR